MAKIKKSTNLKKEIKDAQRRFEMGGNAFNLRAAGKLPTEMRKAEKAFTRLMITKKGK